MSRIVFWLALVFLVMFAVRAKLRESVRRQQRQFQPPPDQSSTQPPGGMPGAYQARAAEKAVAEAEVMLECAHCGVYYPASETVRHEGRDYCSAAHARAPAA